MVCKWVQCMQVQVQYVTKSPIVQPMLHPSQDAIEDAQGLHADMRWHGTCPTLMSICSLGGLQVISYDKGGGTSKGPTTTPNDTMHTTTTPTRSCLLGGLLWMITQQWWHSMLEQHDGNDNGAQITLSALLSVNISTLLLLLMYNLMYPILVLYNIISLNLV